MSRYITELANDIAKSCPDLVENGCGNDNCVACLAFKLIGLGYQKQEWISVEERLPESNKQVLVYYSVGKIDTAYYIRVDGLEFWFKDFDSLRKVTHWMPLPEAPKKGGGE